MAQATLATLSQAGIALPQDEEGKARAIPATLDTGYDSEAAAQALEGLGCDPSRATGRQKHHAPEAEASDAPATAKARMTAKMRTPDGKAVYARRKVIVEPVFGQIKDARGFRRFLLRGLQKIRGEWRLVCLGHTLRKLWRYGCALSAASATAKRPLGCADDAVQGSRRHGTRPWWNLRDVTDKKTAVIWTDTL